MQSPVVGAEELKANNSYEWIAEVTLASNAPFNI
jgi:hypothetical protein